MLSIYIDSALLALPINYATSANFAEELVDRVNHFSCLLDPDCPVRLVISSTIVSALEDCNAYPSYERLQDYLSFHGLTDLYTAHDVISSYYAILSEAKTIDILDEYEIIDVSSVCSDPPFPDGLNPIVMKSETEKIFTNSAVQHRVSPYWAVGSAFKSSESHEYQVNASIDWAVGAKVDCSEIFPIQYSGTVRCIAHLNCCVSPDLSEELWASARSSGELSFAIAFGALNYLNQNGRDVDFCSRPEFTIGPDFLKSLDDNEARGRGRFSSVTRQLCCELASGDFKSASPFINEVTKKQRVRQGDNALAWRCQINTGNPAIRLFYWKVGSKIEFANLDKKKDLSISRGDDGRGTAYDWSKCFT